MNHIPVHAVAVFDEHICLKLVLLHVLTLFICKNTKPTEQLSLSIKQITKHNAGIVRAIFLYRNQCHDWKIMLESWRCEARMQKSVVLVPYGASNPVWVSIIYARTSAVR